MLATLCDNETLPNRAKGFFFLIKWVIPAHKLCSSQKLDNIVEQEY